MLEEMFNGFLEIRQSKGKIISAKVEYDYELAITLNKGFLQNIDIYETAKELKITEADLIILLATVLLIKLENHKKITNSVSKYKFGNNSEFAELIIQAFKIVLKKISVELFYGDISELKIQELNMLVFDTQTFLESYSDDCEDNYSGEN